MRTLLTVKFPVEPFNALVRDGSAGPKIKRILDDAQPEAVYFTEYGGERTALLVVEVKDASQIPKFAEPWFLQFNAAVEFRSVMTPEDLGRADLASMGKKWG